MVRVWPVRADVNLVNVPISPTDIWSVFSCVCPLIEYTWPILSDSLALAFQIVESLFKLPLYIFIYDNLPTKGSADVLNIKAASELESWLISIESLVPALTALISVSSKGFGKKEMMESKNSVTVASI